MSTIYSGLVCHGHGVEQKRELITLTDNDFLDLNWSFSKVPSSKLITLLHGLEVNAQRPYMTGTAKLFNENGVDAVCVNFRGCSGQDNLSFRSYHSGATEDLDAVVQHVLKTKSYDTLYLKGFSLGGNLTLKYLGERENLPIEIKAAVVVSVPCDLYGSCKALHTLKNKPYHDKFKTDLKNKLLIKQKNHPDLLSVKEIKSIKTLKDFDDVYTSKAHGFRDALDYYKQSSSLQFLPHIKIPTLIINALNDSFLTPECYPVKEAKSNTNLHLEMPKHGGHVGFHLYKGIYYNESRALAFIQDY